MSDEPSQQHLWRLRGRVSEADLVAWLGVEPDEELVCKAWCGHYGADELAPRLALLGSGLALACGLYAGWAWWSALAVGAAAYVFLRLRVHPTVDRQALYPGKVRISPHELVYELGHEARVFRWSELTGCQPVRGHWDLRFGREVLHLQQSQAAEQIAHAAQQVVERRRWYAKPFQQVESREDAVPDAAISLARMTGPARTERGVSLAEGPDESESTDA